MVIVAISQKHNCADLSVSVSSAASMVQLLALIKTQWKPVYIKSYHCKQTKVQCVGSHDIYWCVCRMLPTEHPSSHSSPMVATKNNCPVWAPLETQWCNMADSSTGSFNGNGNTTILSFRWLDTNENTIIIIIMFHLYQQVPLNPTHWTFRRYYNTIWISWE